MSRALDSAVAVARTFGQVTQAELDSINQMQKREENKRELDSLGGVSTLSKMMKIDLKTGLKESEIEDSRAAFGKNSIPEKPMKSWCRLFFESFEDVVLLVLIVAAVVSFGVGIFEDPEKGWIEGCAILIAVLLVAVVTATNDYSKEMKFRELEKAAQKDETAQVIRAGEYQAIHPDMLVVGDILSVTQGVKLHADAVLFECDEVEMNESSLTGEAELQRKRKNGDPFLLSSSQCISIGNAKDARAIVVGVGPFSQWGQIQSRLQEEADPTPLQDKLEDMAMLIGYGGTVCAVGTFIVMVVMIWVKHDGQNILHHIIHAFIIAVTIVVVAIPEGLPLAVTISLAYSTKKMYEDNNLIRHLHACETMGNATNICSDKTGTLTENRMTVVEGWFADKSISQYELRGEFASEKGLWKDCIVENCAVNRQGGVRVVYNDEDTGAVLERPIVFGNPTEGALLMLAHDWGYDCDAMSRQVEDGRRLVAEIPFTSTTKRATVIVKIKVDGVDKLRMYVKGASEIILSMCTHYLTSESAAAVELTTIKKRQLASQVDEMAGRALRTLSLAHRDLDATPERLANPKAIDWVTLGAEGLCCDAVIGIIDPLRGDVKRAVYEAQQAGVTVRMVTGDNLMTATAIAYQAGIMREGDIALEGPEFRKLTPAQLDNKLSRLAVLARSSPDDKYLLVSRLNGHGLPDNKEEWLLKHEGHSWENDRDLLLPGYAEEWEQTHVNGGDVVGVTGDGTNDAPALKAANVGLAMGITGTEVAKGASDIVILDDKFSSIVRAIKWGRCVYDNIRKFLQFQLTVNVVALTVVFIGAVAGLPPPLNAVMMLWVNLIMDTMGALALGTEQPDDELLTRAPYKRDSMLINGPMTRNVLFQSGYQLILLLTLLFKGPGWFDVPMGEYCRTWKASADPAGKKWGGAEFSAALNIPNKLRTDCGTFFDGVAHWPDTAACLEAAEGREDGFPVGLCTDDTLDWGPAEWPHLAEIECGEENLNGVCFDEVYEHLGEIYPTKCLVCADFDYRHYSIIFNAFVFCQVFNEFNARFIFDDVNCFKQLHRNPMFLVIIFITVVCQVVIIAIGGDFTRTTWLNMNEWLITVALALITFPVGVIMRFLPVKEDPNSFAVTSKAAF